MPEQKNMTVPRFGRFDHRFASSRSYENPLNDISIHVKFASPSGRTRSVEGFWDGDNIWRVRFSPDETGEWTYVTSCSDRANGGLNGQTGSFDCSESMANTPFAKHGPVRLADNRRNLVHADGTPFFWMADTAWNGPLRASDEEWAHYLNERVRQKFSAVQWVTTQWVAAPDGDLKGDIAYTGIERIQLNPAFFQQLDRKVDAISAAGMLSVPVLLWTAGWSTPEGNRPNPGWTLPEDQAILLARYIVARWGAYDVVWILNGDGDYRDKAVAERWRSIGRGVFGDSEHAPVSLHPQGLQWNLDDFIDEEWLDIIGYQGGHYSGEDALTWLLQGPPAVDWQRQPIRPIINLEPPYENITTFDTNRLLNEFQVRRALYWSLLISPVAGVTYGGHGVWGWDDGTTTPVNHPSTGVPLSWQQAINMPIAEQLIHLRTIFDSIKWWQLMPAQDIVAAQPGATERERYITATCSEAGDLGLIYVPASQQLELDLKRLKPGLVASWIDPRTGQRHEAGTTESNLITFVAPTPGDWVLVLQFPLQ